MDSPRNIRMMNSTAPPINVRYTPDIVGLTCASLTKTAEKLIRTAPAVTIRAPDVAGLFKNHAFFKME